MMLFLVICKRCSSVARTRNFNSSKGHLLPGPVSHWFVVALPLRGGGAGAEGVAEDQSHDHGLKAAVPVTPNVAANPPMPGPMPPPTPVIPKPLPLVPTVTFPPAIGVATWILPCPENPFCKVPPPTLPPLAVADAPPTSPPPPATWMPTLPDVSAHAEIEPDTPKTQPRKPPTPPHRINSPLGSVSVDGLLNT
jgi:hypothetical protein